MKILVSRYDKKMIGQLPKILFTGRIIVIQSQQEAAKAVEYLLKKDIIGIDTETRPVFRRGEGMNPVALLQVSTHDTCFLFRLNMIGFTDELVRLMSDESIVRIGLSLKDDFAQLRRRKPFVPGPYKEIQSMVKEMGIVDQSLQKLYANIFGMRISKTQQLSNWEADVLTEAQQRYAATDAWACIQLYEELLRLDETGYMLEIVPDPEPQVFPTLSEEELQAKQERKKAKEKEKRQRRSFREKEQKERNKNRKNKELLRSMEQQSSTSVNNAI